MDATHLSKIMKVLLQEKSTKSQKIVMIGLIMAIYAIFVIFFLCTIEMYVLGLLVSDKCDYLAPFEKGQKISSLNILKNSNDGHNMHQNGHIWSFLAIFVARTLCPLSRCT